MTRRAEVRLDHAGTALFALDLVLRNLIENALKHHDRAGGRVLASARPTADGVEITVEDDGPGIPRDRQAAAFRPFTRLDDDPAKDGVGMGLALVQRAVQSVGGSIEIVSAPEAARGTRFRIVWPKL